MQESAIAEAIAELKPRSAMTTTAVSGRVIARPNLSLVL